MLSTPEIAIRKAREQSATGPKFGVGECLMRCRLAYGVNVITHDAARSWAQSKRKHATTRPGDIPRGALVYWTGGSKGFGHIAIATGNGECWSTDIRRTGYFDKVKIADVAKKWPSLRLAGWSEELNGVHVFTPPATPVPAPVKVPAVTPVARPAGKTARVDGADISHHQNGTLDLAAAKKAGIRFLFHKATEGATIRDTMYLNRRQLAARAGIPFGAYHFARPDKDGRDGTAEARAFLAYATPRPGDLRPVLDLEDRNGLTRAQLSRWVRDFVTECKRQTGVPPIIYTPFDLDDHLDCPLWVARYSDAMNPPKVPAPWKTWTIWQFSNGHLGQPDAVAGLGHVDLNTLNGDPGRLVAALRIPTVKVPPKPAAKRTLRIGYWNALRGRAPATVLAELVRLTADLDVLMVSECNGYAGILTKVPGFTRVGFYDAPEQGESVILVRTGLTVTHARAEQLTSDPDGKGPAIAGWFTGSGEKTPAKWATVARVNGAAFISCHTPPSVQTLAQRLTSPRRWRAYKQLVASLADLVQKLVPTVVIGCDWNVDATSDKGTVTDFPRSALTHMGLVRACPTSGTHGNRVIDYFGVRSGTVSNIRALPGYGSDHKPVTGTLTY